MLSRARHGVVATHSRVVSTLKNYPKPRNLSEYWTHLLNAEPFDACGIDGLLSSAPWSEIAER